MTTVVPPRDVVAPVAVRFDQWFDCPDCRHPATAVYLGRISCNRCGWPRQLKSED